MENNKVKEFFNEIFGEVRTINKDGELWFVASDVAKTLEYRDAKNMIRNLDEDEADTQTLSIRSENGVYVSDIITVLDDKDLYTHVVSTLGVNQELSNSNNYIVEKNLLFFISTITIG